MKFSEKELALFDSKKGLLALLEEGDKINLNKTLKFLKYEKRIGELQEEMIKLQNWVVKNNQRVIVVFEGRDAAGKGGAIRRATEFLNPREHRVVALPKPDEIEKGQWYFQRYVNQLPRAGEIVFFDRSWYNRAIVEPVNGFCTEEQYQNFMDQVNAIEKMWINSGIYLIKFYFSISKEEQAKRFEEIKISPLKRWKFSDVDARALELWEVYTDYKNRMFKITDTKISPWVIINANKKEKARVAAIKHILKTIPYTIKDEEVLINQHIDLAEED